LVNSACLPKSFDVGRPPGHYHSPPNLVKLPRFLPSTTELVNSACLPKSFDVGRPPGHIELGVQIYYSLPFFTTTHIIIHS